MLMKALPSPRSAVLFDDELLEAAYRLHIARRSRQVASGTFLCQALFLAICVLRLLFHKALSPRRLLVVVLSSLGFVLDVWVARTLTLTTRKWLARSEVLKAWVFLVNTTLAMIIALLVKDGEIPLMSQLPLFHTVLNSGLNYLLQFPAPTGAYVQAVCLVCSFYHELAHWIIEERRPVRCLVEMLVCLGVAYVCVAANAWRDEQTRRRFAAAHRQHMAAAAAAAAG